MALGFTVQDRTLDLGGVRVELERGGNGGITSWALDQIEDVNSIDGLPTEVVPGPPPPGPEHPNRALGIDHVVVTTPDFDRTAAALAGVGLELRRIRETGRGRQGFRRLGPLILELVEVSSGERSEPARFWGLVVVVSDLEALAERLGEHLAPAKDAVQPGRRIATLRASAGISPAVAFMTPEP
ncbi:MAG TPA: hypothetical protein VGF70_07585 [Solirubrobacteraceae bacterium]|jgi:hypothetical protein